MRIPVTKPFLVALSIGTMGHAGPEGRYAILGWFCSLINLPGLAITGWLLPASVQSDQIRSAIAVLIQLAVLTSIFSVCRLVFTKNAD